VHTFLVFFGWPMGAVYGNILASALVAVWVTVQSRSVKAVQAEVRDLHEKHHAEQMNALSLDTPGGLAAVMDVARDAKTAAESAHGAVKGLALVAGAPEPAAAAATVKTPMKRATRSRAAPKEEPPVKAPAGPAGMGSRIAPKTPRGKA